MEVVLLMLEVSGFSQVVIWVSPSRRVSGKTAWNDELTATSNGSVPLRPFKRRD